MINIYLSGKNYFVWNEDVMELRKHRIVGALTGINRNRRFQVQAKWLPLQLMHEEAYLIIDKGLAKLLLSPEKPIDPHLAEHYLQNREKSCDEQKELFKNNREKTIKEKADVIAQGIKRKLEMGEKTKKNEKVIKSSAEMHSVHKDNEEALAIVVEEKKTESEMSSEIVVVDSDKVNDMNNKDIILCDEVENSDKEDQVEEHITSSQTPDDSTSRISHSFKEIASQDIEKEFPDKKTIINAELAKIPEVSKDLCMVQLFTECPWKNKCAIAEIRHPSTEMEKLRYAVFKDLWEKEYYITSGLKFGGDFLAYEGDPLKYHASFIVVCIPKSMNLLAIDILTYGRLGHQVKKSVVLASTEDSGKVEYISVTWANDIS